MAASIGTNAQAGNYNFHKAMQHPLRSKCLRRLIDRGPMSPAELARELDAELHHVSYHVKRLVLYGCAELVDTRPVRGATEHFYEATERLRLEPALARLAETSAEPTEPFVDEFMQSINEDFLAAQRAGVVGLDGHCHTTRTLRQLDRRALVEMLELAERMRSISDQIEQRALERASEGGGELTPVSESILVFALGEEPLDGAHRSLGRDGRLQGRRS